MKVLGINDEVTVCACCGKTNLKKTVIIATDDCSIVRYGSACAAILLGRKETYVKKVAESAESKAQSISHYVISHTTSTGESTLFGSGAFPGGKRFYDVVIAQERANGLKDGKVVPVKTGIIL